MCILKVIVFRENAHFLNKKYLLAAEEGFEETKSAASRSVSTNCYIDSPNLDDVCEWMWIYLVFSVNLYKLIPKRRITFKNYKPGEKCLQLAGKMHRMAGEFVHSECITVFTSDRVASSFDAKKFWLQIVYVQQKLRIAVQLTQIARLIYWGNFSPMNDYFATFYRMFLLLTGTHNNNGCDIFC